jgi:hypothetical protein
VGCSQIWNTNLCISVVTIIYSRKIFYIFLSLITCSLKLLLFLCSLGITNGTSSIISKHLLLTYFSTGELLKHLHINIWHNLLTGSRPALSFRDSFLCSSRKQLWIGGNTQEVQGRICCTFFRGRQWKKICYKLIIHFLFTVYLCSIRDFWEMSNHFLSKLRCPFLECVYKRYSDYSG